jgi:hypothetical protein
MGLDMISVYDHCLETTGVLGKYSLFLTNHKGHREHRENCFSQKNSVVSVSSVVKIIHLDL